MAILDEIGATIRQLAEGAGSSVVGVGQRWGVGSGIVLGEGTVLTNAHNVRGDRVTVTFADGRTAEGNVAGHDIDGDLAVIGVDTGGAPALPWADGAAAEIGTPVFALANPGGRGLRVTFGFVSGVERILPGPARPAHHRQPRAHRPAAARLLRRPGSHRRGAAARDQHQPPRRGLLPGHTRRRGTTGPGRRTRPRGISTITAARHRHRAQPRRQAAAPRRRPARHRRPARPRRSGRQPGRPRRTRPGRPDRSGRGSARYAPPTTCSTHSRPHRAAPSSSPSPAAPRNGPSRSPSEIAASQITRHKHPRWRSGGPASG